MYSKTSPESPIPFYTPLTPPSLPRRRMPKGGNRMLYVVVGVLLFGMFLTMVNVYELRRMQDDHKAIHMNPVVEAKGQRMTDQSKPVVWIHAKKMETGYLSHVFKVFERVGYNTQGTKDSDWDVLWAHDYPFSELKDIMLNLKPHQRVNHWPGCGFITNKVSLATSPIKHIPKAFKMPLDKAEFLEYAKTHQDTMWVQKSNNHRGIKIQKITELNLGDENTFIQEYVDKPFLIDGRRFDIGIYATLTSIDPLRAYVYHGDWLVRYCTEEYYPFDQTVLDKYVIGDDYVPTWKMPSLKRLFTEFSFNHKETLRAYIKQIGKDADKLWSELKAAVSEVYITKESNLAASTSKYKSNSNFFEMVRFDFVLDENLNIYLMEVNMSPNLSSGHFPLNKHLYEPMIFNLLGLVGIAHHTEQAMHRSSADESVMQVSDADIQVFADSCISSKCAENCLAQECRLCHGCLTVDQKNQFKTAYLEHLNRKNWRRVVPAAMTQASAAKIKSTGEKLQLGTKNKLMTMWFAGKCMQDATWCE